MNRLDFDIDLKENSIFIGGLELFATVPCSILGSIGNVLGRTFRTDPDGLVVIRDPAPGDLLVLRLAATRKRCNVGKDTIHQSWRLSVVDDHVTETWVLAISILLNLIHRRISGQGHNGLPIAPDIGTELDLGGCFQASKVV